MNCRPRPDVALPSAAGASGFALMELLITVAIIFVFFTMFFGFGAKKRQRSAKLRCQENLQKAFVGLQIFANEHDERFPQTTNATTAEVALEVLVPRYTADTKIFVCPGRKDSAPAPDQLLRQGRISYSYYQGHTKTGTNGFLLTDWQVNTQAKRIGDLLFSETGKRPGNNHAKTGGNLLEITGDVISSPARAAVDLLLPAGVVLLNPKP